MGDEKEGILSWIRESGFSFERLAGRYSELEILTESGVSCGG